jgi:hypothetical protein
MLERRIDDAILTLVCLIYSFAVFLLKRRRA